MGLYIMRYPNSQVLSNPFTIQLTPDLVNRLIRELVSLRIAFEIAFVCDAE